MVPFDKSGFINPGDINISAGSQRQVIVVFVRGYGYVVTRTHRLAPAEHCEQWPDVACGDNAAEAVRRLVVNLNQALGEDSVRSLARLSGIDHSVIGRLRRGEVWPDAQTIARLEATLDADLWPGRVRPSDLR